MTIGARAAAMSKERPGNLNRATATPSDPPKTTAIIELTPATTRLVLNDSRSSGEASMALYHLSEKPFHGKPSRGESCKEKTARTTIGANNKTR